MKSQASPPRIVTSHELLISTLGTSLTLPLSTQLGFPLSSLAPIPLSPSPTTGSLAGPSIAGRSSTLITLLRLVNQINGALTKGNTILRATWLALSTAERPGLPTAAATTMQGITAIVLVTRRRFQGVMVQLMYPSETISVGKQDQRYQIYSSPLRKHEESRTYDLQA